MGNLRLWVHEDFHRRGVATAMVEALRRTHSKPMLLPK